MSDRTRGVCQANVAVTDTGVDKGRKFHNNAASRSAPFPG